MFKLIAWFKRIPVFFREVREELKKVNWSSRKELTGAAIIVVVVSAILTLYIAVVDLALTKGVQAFIK